MIDSVLKGTGNSRFLKSAVPAGTSWADALAMLQAGTFPIDFNGINNAGFQQVGTPLNKANLLKDATALTLGLTGDVVPNDMFNVLAHAGDLHVWRKTVKNAADVPAGYTLGSVNVGSYILYIGNTYHTISYSSSVSVDDSGNVSLKNPTTISDAVPSTDLSFLKGAFMVIPVHDADSYFSQNVMYYIPANVTITRNGQYIYLDRYQSVTGYPLTPAGTTVTYPVSTNRNAYQEGNDAKPAGYTLGEVETGKFKMSASPTSNTFYVNSTIAVSDAGTISFPDGYHFISVGQNSSGPISARDVIGNFMSLYQNKYDGDFEVGDVWFIPSDATITDYVYVTKRQRVTGYAAIPANTTIEYLGCLGDKARAQVVSYVGTGTYGESNPNSLTFDFVPKVVIISSAPVQNSYVYIAIMVPDAGIYSVVMSTYLGYESRTPGGSGIVTKNNKTITFYSGDNTAQLNGSGIKYTAVAIG